MIDTNKVKEILKSISDLDDGEISNYSDLIESCALSVYDDLKENYYESDKRILQYTATKAYYFIALKDLASDNVSSFTAGDITFSKNTNSLQMIKDLMEIAKNDCKQLIVDECFAFLEV